MSLQELFPGLPSAAILEQFAPVNDDEGGSGGVAEAVAEAVAEVGDVPSTPVAGPRPEAAAFTPLDYDSLSSPASVSASATASPARSPMRSPGESGRLTRSLDAMLADVETPERSARARKRRKLLVHGSPSRINPAALVFLAETLHVAKPHEHVRGSDGLVAEHRMFSLVELLNITPSTHAYRMMVLYPQPVAGSEALEMVEARRGLALEAIGPMRGYWAVYCAASELDFVWRKFVDAMAHRGKLSVPFAVVSPTVFADEEAHAAAFVVPVPASGGLAQLRALGSVVVTLTPQDCNTVYYRSCTCPTAMDTAQALCALAVEEEKHLIKSSYKMVAEPVPCSVTTSATSSRASSLSRTGSAGDCKATLRKLSFEAAIAAATKPPTAHVLYAIDRSSGKPWAVVEHDSDVASCTKAKPEAGLVDSLEFVVSAL
ncbi:uncharacterized protein AMSG_08641 [Thecamonas trahens ATCC 50062]|uniref:Uncharacterized protein n=1 Tax=Thecamonas trahens ATCC 50062 TaxID=461836 RepID=A0A0L0DK29_THETB|nr:hypothetical protein AMSG_08641 [Thecamonas trahens ATCC 50062]KNC52759.1 hypothetical protein AMSG_08641 [Thecamonas trahens ATCC 50062]|eukprot:XP_013755072.1 hypothetical protein AMSG_08641 [Thecamonas trahens ATCC 50062]